MTMTRPTVIPHQWPGHRALICMVIVDGEIRFVARDILAAIGADMAGQIEKDPTHEGPMALHGTAVTWNRQQVAQILEPIPGQASPDPRHEELLTWLDTTMRYIVNTVGVRRITELATPEHARPGYTAPVVETPAWYSIEDAARILSADPTVGRISRPALFEVLESRGWIHRVDNHWVPQQECLVVGFLTVSTVRIPVYGANPYAQICITTLGLHKLHGWIGGTTPLNLTGATA